MSIYTYHFSQSISASLGISFEEIPQLSDQKLHEDISNIEHENVAGPYAKHIEKMSLQERKDMTKNANAKKRGMKESSYSRSIKSAAQKKRWNNMTEEQRKEMGRLSRNGMSEESKNNHINAMLKAFSPARQKGIKQPLTTCPYCAKVGGRPIMIRYHFENCKNK